MRILFCNKYNYAFSGTEVYLFELMDLLRSRGHEVALFSMAHGPKEFCGTDSHLTPWVDFKVGHTLWEKVRLAGHAIYSTEARHQLRKIIAEFHPDVAHVRNIYHHLSPSILFELRAQHVPVLYHLNDFKLVCPTYNLLAHGHVCEKCHGGNFFHVITSQCYDGPVGASLVLAAEAYVHKCLRTYQTCVTKIITPSHFARRKLLENGWKDDRMEVLPHFHRLPERASNPAGEQTAILYFGRLSPEKGLVSLLRAMRLLPSIPLQIVGTGPQQPELERIAAELKLSNVQFLGYAQHQSLQQLLAEARFTVMPSLAYETFGKSILESYAAARPVIASDLGSRRELVTHGETGLLYTADDPVHLAASIEFLYTQPGLAREMGQAGYELAKERHSPELHYAALMRIYGELVGMKYVRPLPPAPLRRLRIAFIGGRGVVGKYSGIESYYEEVGRRLAAMGHEVTVYCRNYFTPPLRKHNSMRIVRLPCFRTKHLETLSHTFLSTLHATFGRYDIVHFHALGPALFSFVPRLAGKKTIVTVQGLDWQRKKWNRFASWVLRLGEAAAIRMPNATAVVSRTLRDYYRSKYSAEPAYIPNGTELRRRRVPQHLAGWGLEAQKYVLFLGRFSPEKNCDLLIRAFQQVPGELKLVLAGGSSYSDAYMDALRQQASDRVHLLDWVSGQALDELLSNAMLFVMPSDLEGLSLALLDAMGAGVCVLASDVPENLELTEGVAFTFRRGDEQDLARMLHLLMADEEMRERAGKACQQRVRERYLWSEITGHIEREYLRLMNSSTSAQAETKIERTKVA